MSLGPWEIALIFLVVLLVFGAKRIPEIARGLGKGIREFKDATNDIKREISISDTPSHQQIPPSYPQSHQQPSPAYHPQPAQAPPPQPQPEPQTPATPPPAAGTPPPPAPPTEGQPPV